jgi:aminopeptidase N
LNELLNPNNYQKGAWVLHMLRAELGDAIFFRGVRAYYRAHLNRTARTEDFRAALERASGKNLREFFTRWVYASGHPQYEAAWVWREHAAGRGGVLTLTLKQIQEDGAHFPNAMPVEIVNGTAKRRLKLRPTGRELSTRLFLNKRPTEVRFDPDRTILKELSVRPS